MYNLPKIMLLVPSFGRSSPIYGAYLFAKYLKENGIRVIFVSLDASCHSKLNIIEKINDANIPFKCLNTANWLRWNLRNKSRIQAFIEENYINIVVSFLLRPDLITSKFTGVIKISSVRSMFRKQYPLLYNRAIAHIAASLQIRALKKMHHVFSMTNKMKNWLESEGINPSKISTVNNFVDVSLIRSHITKEELNKDGCIDIGMFCSIIKRKRIDVALKAIYRLVYDYKYSDVRLHITGDGPLRNKMKKMVSLFNIQKNVTFHGFLTKPLKLMDRMNLILLTSEAEGLPRCLMEAFSLGKTVIAADIHGVNELVRHGKTGYLFPNGDDAELADLIHKIILHQLYLPAMQLHDFMIANYDMKTCCKKMLTQILNLYVEKE